ncbi:hypothetical protein O9K51_01032 [Purpureocillium lavendulum]|uniref:Uncharacterized protein n=1 Tax=Purpureocillium lavendulum TaxID=1247861 RepID=A0AB34G6T5_9HYPO|nr:hypothetical protein O9K51_01032 [Purpureocillium lavendulum]
MGILGFDTDCVSQYYGRGQQSPVSKDASKRSTGLRTSQPPLKEGRSPAAGLDQRSKAAP